jgi:hypothetical protein
MKAYLIIFHTSTVGLPVKISITVRRTLVSDPWSNGITTEIV